ncbi:phage tail fiber protein [Klebsiella quasipneumoniae]|uniref:phage tail fiber protein n=1 Tax=Klebsiella quasipneumoniae TaxID=1463165 RepID=UPI003890128A
MTVSTEVDHNDYTGNGVTTSFPYTFRIFKKSDLTVQVADLNENITVLTLDTDYSVTGAGTYSGGNVVLMSPLANGWQISISRDLPVTQETDLRNQGKFFAEVHEDAFDKLTMLIQQCFSFLRLSLRKPSFIANYYDALNNRIRNLRDPSQAQDAATKNYVDGQIVDNTNAWKAGDAILDQKIDANFRKTLRTSENISKVPDLQMRSGMILGFNDNGDPIVVSGQTATADLALKLSSSVGAYLVYRGNSPIAEQIPPSIFEFMTLSDIESIMNNAGVELDIDYALQACVNAGYMTVGYPWPKGVYVHGDLVTIPSGFMIIGEGARKPYTISGDASFNGCGVVIRKKTGASGIFKMSGRHTFKDIVFDGRDKLTGSINSSSQIAGLRFERCGFYRWNNGVGRSSGYLGTVYLSNCNISGNNHGIFNFIDSRVVACTINANTLHGINLQAGANNNDFEATRVEWNGGYGAQAVGAIQNTFSGELVDRNGLSGFFANGGGAWTVIGTTVRRNGATAGSNGIDNCHFRVEGSGSYINVTSVITRAGADDDGGGVVTPEHVITYSGGSSNISAFLSNSSLEGSTLSTIRSVVVPSIRKYRNNTGIPDVSTEGFTQIRNGAPNIGDPIINVNLPVHGVINFTLTASTTGLGTFSSDSITRTIEFKARNNTLTVSESYFLKIDISRVSSGNASLAIYGAELGSATTWGMAGTSPAAVSIALSISSDGSLITGTLTGIDNSERFINIYLRP